MKNNRGLTLIEIIIILTIIGFAIPAILTAFARIVATGADVKTADVATNLAAEKMEEIIKNKKFVDLVSEGPADFTGDFSQYNYQVIVDYVDAANLDTPAGGQTDFKRIRTIITKDGLSNFNVTLTTVITNLGY